MIDAIRELLRPRRGGFEAGHDAQSPGGEAAKPETSRGSIPHESSETGALELPAGDANKLHHFFDNADHGLGSLIADFGSEEAAFAAVAGATRNAILKQNITGQYNIQAPVGQHTVTVTGRVLNGKIHIGTAYIPWKR